MWDFAAYGNRLALLSDQGSMTYRELEERAGKIAAALPSRVLVFALCQNSPAMVAGYCAFLSHGVVPVMIDAELDAGLLAELVRRYRPSYAWLPAEREALFPDGRELLRMEEYVLLDLAERASFPLHPSLALLMTTSGSTGSPKLVRQSYENLRANTEAIVEYLSITSEERAITSLPLFYVYGLSILNTHLAAGASVVVTRETLFSRDFWRLMREQEVTSLGGVPYTYAMLKRLRFFRMDLPALKTLTQAGGKLDPELHAAFAQDCAAKGRRFFVMYGAAEATARMGYLPAELAVSHVGAMGRAIPGGRFALAGEDGAEVTQAGTPGELVYYGANAALGYAECGEDLVRGDDWHGRYATGDVAVRAADGIYTIVGRKKRFLKMFGKRTNLEEVEHLLRQRFGGEFACGGTDDHLYVFLTEEAVLPQVVPYLSAKLGLHPSAFAPRRLAAIPKNAAGKTLYRELEQYYDV